MFFSFVCLSAIQKQAPPGSLSSPCSPPLTSPSPSGGYGLCVCAHLPSHRRNSHEIRARSNNLRNRDLVIRFLRCYEVRISRISSSSATEAPQVVDALTKNANQRRRFFAKPKIQKSGQCHQFHLRRTPTMSAVREEAATTDVSEIQLTLDSKKDVEAKPVSSTLALKNQALLPEVPNAFWYVRFRNM